MEHAEVAEHDPQDDEDQDGANKATAELPSPNTRDCTSKKFAHRDTGMVAFCSRASARSASRGRLDHEGRQGLLRVVASTVPIGPRRASRNAGLRPLPCSLSCRGRWMRRARRTGPKLCLLPGVRLVGVRQERTPAERQRMRRTTLRSARRRLRTGPRLAPLSPPDGRRSRPTRARRWRRRSCRRGPAAACPTPR